MPDLTWTKSKAPLASSADGGVPEWPMHFKKHMREKDWAPHKQKIIRLRDQGLKTEDIQEYLIREDGFHATIAQYKKILKDWRPKNLKRKQIRYIIYTCKRRGLKVNDTLPRFWYSSEKSKKKQKPYIKESTSTSQTLDMLVYVEDDKVEDTVKRYWKSEVFSPNEHPSPAGLSVAPTPVTVYTPDESGPPSPIIHDSEDILNTNPPSPPCGTPIVAEYSSPMEIENEIVDPVQSVSSLVFEPGRVVGTSLDCQTPEGAEVVQVVDLTISSTSMDESTRIVQPTANQPNVPITEQQIAEFAEDLLQKLNISPSSSGHDGDSVQVADSSVQGFTEWEREQERREKDREKEVAHSQAKEKVALKKDNIDCIVEEAIRGDTTDWIFVDGGSAPSMLSDGSNREEEILLAESLRLEAVHLLQQRKFERALVATESSMELYLVHEGLNGQQFLNMYWLKGRLLRELGRYKDATMHLRRVQAACQKYLGKFDALTLTVSYDLFRVLEKTGPTHEAFKHCELLWRVIAEMPGLETSQDLLNLKDAIMWRYVEILSKTGRVFEEEIFIRARLTESIGIRGENNLETIRLLTSLGDNLTGRGKRRTREALKVYNRALTAAYESKIYKEHPSTFMEIWSGQAFALRQYKWTKRAIFLLRKLLQMVHRVYGEKQYFKEPFFLLHAIQLAAAYGDIKWFDMSLAYLSRAVPLLIDVMGAHHPHTVDGIDLACHMMYSRGMIRYVQPLARDIPMMIERVYGRNHPKWMEAVSKYWDFLTAGKELQSDPWLYF